MFGFLKKLIRKSEPDSKAAALPISYPATQTPSAPAAAVSTPARAARTALPSTASKPAAPVLRAPVVPEEPLTSSGETLDLPLLALWPKFKPSLTSSATGQPASDALLRLPVELVRRQLGRGAVKIPYGQFREMVPGKLFPVSPPKDCFEIEIPLAEILPRLRPEFFSKRPDQKKVEVPDEIGSIFGPEGAHGLRIVDTKATGRPPAPIPVPAKTAAASPAPAPSIKPQMPLQPTAQTASPTPIVPSPLPPAACSPAGPSIPEPIRTTLDPSLATLRPKAANGSVKGPLHGSSIGAVNGSPKPLVHGTPAVPAPGVVSPQLSKTTVSGTFTLALMDVAAFWTDKGKDELANLYRHSVEIPMNTLDAALRTGKLVFPWREVRHWIRLAPGNTLPTISDDLEVEFPLALIAPRYMEQRGPARPARKIEFNTDIPEVFAPKPVAAPPAAVVASEPAAEAEPAVAPRFDLKETEPGKSRGFGDIFGEPEKTDWSLADIIRKVSGLEGIAGAIVGTEDGLMIAGSWPDGVKSDSVAGLIPQMYNRVAQYTRELKLGDPGDFTLLIENRPLQIFKAANSYLTVIGRPGESLPATQLKAVASRLAAGTHAK